MHLDIISYRLHNQRLSQNKLTQAADVVRCLGAIQAQDFSGAKWAIGLRSDGLTDSDVGRAFDEGSILRTHMLRPTWHFVAPEDIRWMLALTAPRVRAQMAYLDRKLEVDKGLLKKSNAVLTRTLQGGKQLTRAELERAYQGARLPAKGQRLGHLLMHAELDGIVCSGPRRGKQFTSALLEEWIPRAGEMTREESLAELMKRYFLTRGPATLADFAWWSGLTLADAKTGMDMVRSYFVSGTSDGQTYWFAEGKMPIQPHSNRVYLLPNYDEFVIGYKDRRAIGKAAEQAGIKRNDPALLANIILLDGQIVGGWRRTLAKDTVQVEASLLQRLDPNQERSLVHAAEQFGRFLGLPASLMQKEYRSGKRTSRSF